MAFLDFLFGRKEKLKKIPTLSPQQSTLLNQLLGQVSPQQLNVEQQPTFQAGQSFLQQLLSQSPEAMQQFQAPFMRQFQEQIIPSIAERFSAMGSGAQSSSAFQQALGQAGAGLAEQLASLRGQLGLQAIPSALGFAQAPGQRGLGLAQLGLGTSPFAYRQIPGSTGLAGPALQAIGAGFGLGAGTSMLGKFLGSTPQQSQMFSGGLGDSMAMKELMGFLS